MIAVNVAGLAKTYGSGENAVPVIKGLDFSMEKGAYEAVMGPSGSGKSTFLHLLAGLLKADAGTIEIGGRALTGLNDDDLTLFRRRHIGLIFQDFNLIPTLTAEENVALPLLLDGTEAEHKAHVDELLDALGLSNRRHHLPAKLSGGERQRVAIARALAGDPDVVLADEPSGNLDSPAARALCDLLRQLNRKLGCTILVVSHDPIVAASADRVHLLRDGTFTGDFETGGNVERVMERYLAIMAR
jgi:putative ABC transport system ATP-binding protein